MHIPQTALLSLVCDSCHKYLSVTPVKVFPNRRIKCGRCISEEDEGAISMYNQVALKSSFRCINHYEGCKALLNTSEVLEHEQTCESKTYNCPNCNEEIPSYFMYKHFTHTHKKLILKRAYFVINESENQRESEKPVHFLYCYKDYMIFVKYSAGKDHNYCTNALFKFSLLNSKTDEGLKINVVINSGKEIIEREIDCDIFPLETKDDVIVKLNVKITIVVTFSLQEPNSMLEIPNSKVEIPKATNKELSDVESKKYLDLYFRENETVGLADPLEKKEKVITLCVNTFIFLGMGIIIMLFFYYRS